jgi:hypothetical protein
MKISRLIISLILVTVFTVFAAASQEQWLTYHSIQNAFDSVPRGYGYSKTLSEKTPDGVAIPKFISDKVLYAKWSSPLCEKKEIWMAFDSSKKGAYDLLYFDTNCNGSLSDEKPIKGTSEWENEISFGPVPIVLAGEDGPVTYHIKINLYTNNTDGRVGITLWPGGWYEGEISIGDKKLKCRLIDQNGDGDFTTQGTILLGNDEQGHSVGKYLQYEKKLYQLEVPRDGAYIKLSEAQDVVFADFTVPPNISSVLLDGANGSFLLTPENGKCRIPAGLYRVEEWKVARTDDKGKNWELIGRYMREQVNLDSNKPGQNIAIGEPVSCKLAVKPVEGTYQFSQSFANASYANIEVQCNKERITAPKLHIRNKDGSYDKTYSLEYG